MFEFVLLICVATCAQLSLARPDVSLGYQYRPGYSSSAGNFLQTPHTTGDSYFSAVPAFASSSLGGGYAGAVGSGGSVGIGGVSTSTYPSSLSSSAYNTGFGGLSGSFGGTGDFSGSANAGNGYQSDYNSGNVHYSHQSSNFVGRAPIVSKHFWLHSAPEDHDEQQIVRYINVGQPRKNYHVVFINTPSSNVNKAKIIANIAPVEDKTAIYVLAKKSNALDVTAEVATPTPIVNKPEVFFVKYKTAEEAAHAQHTIQAQYDALGGSSEVSNEGAIPISSAIGSLDGSLSGGDDNAGDSHAVHNGAPISVVPSDSKVGSSQNYLPPNHK